MIDKETLKLRLILLLAIVWCGTGFAQATDGSSESSFSHANNRLFFENHLHNINGPTTLTYAFDKKSTFENDESFSDTVKIKLLPASDDKKNAKVEYFSGERKRFAPDFNSVIGNPVLTVALQRDIYQMEQLLNNGTTWRHFQKRLKIAFEEAAESQTTEIEYAGNTYEAEQIVVQPFLSDPMSKRFPALKDKRYTFTLSENVPGTFYQIVTEVETNADGNAMKESYTLIAPSG